MNDLEIFNENSNNFEKSILEIAEFMKKYRENGYTDTLFRKLIYANNFEDTDKILDDLEVGIRFIRAGRKIENEKTERLVAKGFEIYQGTEEEWIKLRDNHNELANVGNIKFCRPRTLDN